MKDSITKNKKIILSILSIVLIYFLLLIGSLLVNNTLVFPRPHKIIISFFELLIEKSTYIILYNTFLRLLISLLISFVLAFILGIISGIFKDIEILLSPIITIIKSVPIVAITILIMSIYGFDYTPYVTTIIMIFPLIYQAIVEGIKNIKKEYIEVYKLDSSINFTVLKNMHIPLIKHNIYLGLVQSFGIGIKVLVVCEFMVSTKNSIGQELINQKNLLNFDKVFAYCILLVLIISLLEYLSKKLKLNINYER